MAFDNLTKEEIKQKLVEFLRPIAKKEPRIKDVYLTKWHEDPFIRMGYSFYAVGGSRAPLNILRRPIDNKVWFVGEHTRLEHIGTTHGAYLTGKEAAYDILTESNQRLDLTTFE